MAAPEVTGPQGEHLETNNEATSDALCSAYSADKPSAEANVPASTTGCSGEASCPDAAEGGPRMEACGAPMSKNRQKKLKRQAAFEAKKAAKKAEEKAAKRAHQERKLSEVQKMIAEMSEDERKTWEEQMAQKRQVCSLSCSDILPKIIPHGMLICATRTPRTKARVLTKASTPCRQESRLVRIRGLGCSGDRGKDSGFLLTWTLQTR